MLRTLEISWYVIWHEYGLLIGAGYVLSALLFGLYLRATNAQKWWVGCIPLVNVTAKKWAAGFSWLLLIPYYLFNILFLIFGDAILYSCLALVINVVVNFLFARSYVSTGAAVYAFVPFAKYVIMFKEAMECKSSSKAKNTKKRSSMKSS